MDSINCEIGMPLRKGKPQEGGGIDASTVEANAKVQMRPGGASRRTDPSNLLPLLHYLTWFHQEPLEVKVDGIQAKAMIEHEGPAAEEMFLGQGHAPGVGGPNDRS